MGFRVQGLWGFGFRDTHARTEPGKVCRRSFAQEPGFRVFGVWVKGLR